MSYDLKFVIKSLKSIAAHCVRLLLIVFVDLLRSRINPDSQTKLDVHAPFQSSWLSRCNLPHSGSHTASQYSYYVKSKYK